jgi:hypothetical protein
MAQFRSASVLRFLRVLAIVMACPVVLLCLGGAGRDSALVISEAGSRSELDVTVYNSNLALVREVRKAELPGGVFSLEFRDVPAQIEPRSLLVESSDRLGLRILEQNYEFDLMSKEKILEKYVGRQVSWIREDGERISGRLLGMTAGPVFEVGEEIVFEVPGRIALPTLPEDLRARPTLVWKTRTERAGTAAVTASYLTRGVSWSADYVLQLDRTGRSAGLQAWVSLDNRCGAAFADARLLLIAGDIHQAQPPMSFEAPRLMGAKADLEAFAVTEEALYDYHLYTLPGKTTLKDAQIKQVSLFEAENIKVARHYRLRSLPAYYRGGDFREDKEKIQVFYSFRNEETNNLGMPLPAGVVRVYGQASGGSRQMLGEDRILHTPKDEEIELQVGAAFDITAERKRMDYRRVSDRVHESEFQITLRNHKDEDVLVEVTETVGGDWRVIQESHPHEKLSATEIRFDLPVPADGETVLKYRVQVTY